MLSVLADSLMLATRSGRQPERPEERVHDWEVRLPPRTMRDLADAARQRWPR